MGLSYLANVKPKTNLVALLLVHLCVLTMYVTCDEEVTSSEIIPNSLPILSNVIVMAASNQKMFGRITESPLEDEDNAEIKLKQQHPSLSSKSIAKRSVAVDNLLKTTTIYMCLDGIEINLAWLCDGDIDCEDGDDENADTCELYILPPKTTTTTTTTAAPEQLSSRLTSAEEDFQRYVMHYAPDLVSNTTKIPSTTLPPTTTTTTTTTTAAPEKLSSRLSPRLISAGEDFQRYVMHYAPDLVSNTTKIPSTTLSPTTTTTTTTTTRPAPVTSEMPLNTPLPLTTTKNDPSNISVELKLTAGPIEPRSEVALFFRVLFQHREIKTESSPNGANECNHLNAIDEQSA